MWRNLKDIQVFWNRVSRLACSLDFAPRRTRGFTIFPPFVDVEWTDEHAYETSNSTTAMQKLISASDIKVASSVPLLFSSSCFLFHFLFIFFNRYSVSPKYIQKMAFHLPGNKFPNFRVYFNFQAGCEHVYALFVRSMYSIIMRTKGSSRVEVNWNTVAGMSPFHFNLIFRRSFNCYLQLVVETATAMDDQLSICWTK